LQWSLLVKPLYIFQQTGQTLLSEEALLTCMAYLDLKPVCADMCNTPETSKYTSIKERSAPRFDLNQAADDEIIQQ